MARDGLIGKTVRLPPELWDALAKQAKKMERSANYVIIQAVKDHVVKVVPDVGKLVSSQYQSGTNMVLPTPSPAGARSSSGKEEEKKSKKKKGRGLAPLLISEDVIGYLNEQAGTAFQPSADAHRKLIQARMNDGATVEDLKTVIRKKCAEWRGGQMQTNLKPSTLFRASNFEGYLGQLDTVASGQQSFAKTQKHSAHQDYSKQTPEDDPNDF